MVVASTCSDFLLAFGGGLVATLAWTAVVLAVRRCRHELALRAFVGDYERYSKLKNKHLGKARVTLKGHELAVEFPGDPKGPVSGTITLNERFRKTGLGLYEHKVPEGLAWGTWDVRLGSSGDTIFVTTRYVDDVDPVEVVQGAEWRRVSSNDASAVMSR
jgi:hypothetical protein